MAEPRKAAPMGTPAAKALPSDQVESRGYLISEDDEMGLKDASAALNAIALICDEHGANVLDLSGSDYAAILRSFGRLVKDIHTSAAFSHKAMVPRQVH